MTEPTKTLFVICPIGADDSPERKASDELLEYVIEPVSRELYHIERADKIMKAGSITSQIFDLLISADIVIADMTGHNANVFYELAVRHAIGKPVVHMIATGGKGIPFDVADQRAIYYTLTLGGAKAARDSLTKMVAEIEGGNKEPPSPISAAVQRKLLTTASPSTEQRDSEILSMLSDIRLRVNRIDDASAKRGGAGGDILEQMVDLLADIDMMAVEPTRQSAWRFGLSAIELFEALSLDDAFPSELRHYRPSQLNLLSTAVSEIASGLPAESEVPGGFYTERRRRQRANPSPSAVSADAQ